MKGSRLIAVYQIWNESQYLEESLKSIRDKVDLIVIVDGAFKKFRHKVPWSTDGTIEIAKRYVDILIETKKPWKNEVTKRNQYLIGKPGDFYLVMGGHEMWSGNLTPPFATCSLKSIQIVNCRGDVPSWMISII